MNEAGFEAAAAMKIRAVKFRVDADWRVGALYSPAVPGRRGAVLFLHGFPGIQKNEDIAAEMCRRGFVAFIPHFRGSWGSGGTFCLQGLLEDGWAARRLLGRYHHVDDARVAVVGLSLGGWVALRLLAAGVRFAAGVLIAPMVQGEISPRALAYARANGKMIRMTRPDALVMEFARLTREDPIENHLRRMPARPMLYVQGINDTVAIPASTRRLWSLTRHPKKLLLFDDEEHELQNDRAVVVRGVCDWLEEHIAERRPAASPTR